MEHKFGEKSQEEINGQKLPVWQSPKYRQSKQKAIELLESKEYKDVLNDDDFWILKNTIKNKTMVAYSGLIISHNACLKINSTLSKEKRFKPECFRIDRDSYKNGLIGLYCDDELYEVGEVSPSNCKNDYPYAMLLKRTFDRVVLKKSGIAMWGVYSDSEADEFKQPYEEQTEPDEEQTEEREFINQKEWERLKLAYSKEEIKGMYAKLGITSNKNFPLEYYKQKMKEWDQKFDAEHPDQDYF